MRVIIPTLLPYLPHLIHILSSPTAAAAAMPEEQRHQNYVFYKLYKGFPQFAAIVIAGSALPLSLRRMDCNKRRADCLTAHGSSLIVSSGFGRRCLMNAGYWRISGIPAPRLICALISAWCLLALAPIVRAHRPALEDQFRTPPQVGPCDGFSQFSQKASTITDPTLASLSIYGRLEFPNEIDLYAFVPAKSESIPVEAMVPVRHFNYNFRPALIIVGRDVTPSEQSNSPESLPIKLPDGFRARVIMPPEGERGAFIDRRTFERLYHGNEQWIRLTAGQPYYIGLYDPNHFTGSYSLGLGAVDNFKGFSKYSILKTVLAIKMGMFGGRSFPWLDFMGLLMLVTGLTLGAGTVIIIWLSRKSADLMVNQSDRASRILRLAMKYVWIGIALAVAGGALLYRQTQLSGVATFQAMLAVALIFYAVYLSARKVEAGKGLAVFSAVWVSQLLLFAWYLLMVR